MRTWIALIALVIGLVILAGCGQSITHTAPTEQQQVASIAHAEASLNRLWAELTAILGAQPPLSQAQRGRLELDVQGIVAACDAWQAVQPASPGLGPALSYWQAGLKLRARAAAEYSDLVEHIGPSTGSRADADQESGALAIDLAIQVIDNLPVRPAYALPPAF
jgi:uncharacterized protein YceK